MSASALNAALRASGDPTAIDTRSPCVCAQSSTSSSQTFLATRSGAITSTLSTSKSNSMSRMAVRLMMVLPSPMSIQSAQPPNLSSVSRTHWTDRVWYFRRSSRVNLGMDPEDSFAVCVVVTKVRLCSMVPQLLVLLPLQLAGLAFRILEFNPDVPSFLDEQAIECSLSPGRNYFLHVPAVQFCYPDGVSLNLFLHPRHGLPFESKFFDTRFRIACSHK